MTRNAPAWIGMTVLAAASCYLAAAQWLGGGYASEPQALTRLATGIGLLIVICGAAMLGQRDRISMVLRQAVTWCSVLLATAVVYAYRAEFREVGGPVVAELLQIEVAANNAQVRASAMEAAENLRPQNSLAVISAGRGGQFFVEAMVNGSHVQFVADTGATLVALTAEDAERIGFDEANLDFRYRHRTANGIAQAAHVVLDEISIGPVTLENVRASVSRPGDLHISLLGMSYLSQLSSFHIRGDQLVLQQ